METAPRWRQVSVVSCFCVLAAHPGVCLGGCLGSKQPGRRACVLAEQREAWLRASVQAEGQGQGVVPPGEAVWASPSLLPQGCGRLLVPLCSENGLLSLTQESCVFCQHP